ncbi:SecDF P1 head subdomain-containing protein [Psychroserpens damuponensis]|uniref:SecDF P1 head subdomain-containing protein n=1 Tax=Psychroserpens damuponensis TaxID=943936 RepID=UPI000590C5D7|nr:hypothetical protein [Psychroserpens damuponensis]
MNKNALVLIVLCVLFSCGNVTPKHKFAIIYKFENLDKVTSNEKLATIEVLKKRLDQLASNYEVSLNNKQQIEVKLLTNYDFDAVNSVITNQGKLEFWEVVKREELVSFIIEANNYHKKDTNADAINPLMDLIQPNVHNYTGLFSVAIKDTLKMRTLLENKGVKQLLPLAVKHSKYLFGLPNEDGFMPLYLVKTPTNGLALVNETHITNASQTYSSNNRPSVSISMNKKGAERWERMTALAYQNQSQIAVTLNDIVYSAPTVASGAITGGRTEVSGSFSAQEAKDLALVFNSQKRIPKLKFVDSSSINDKP